MKKYRLWALEVPDLHPEGFKPRLGGMRLFGGGDGGGGDGGPGGTDPRDEGVSQGSLYGGDSTAINDPFSFYDPNVGAYGVGVPAPTNDGSGTGTGYAAPNVQDIDDILFGPIWNQPIDFSKMGQLVTPKEVAALPDNVENRVIDDFITDYPELSVGTTTPSVIDNIRGDIDALYGGSADLFGLPAPAPPAPSEPAPGGPAGYLYGMEDRPVQFETQPAPARDVVAPVSTPDYLDVYDAIAGLTAPPAPPPTPEAPTPAPTPAPAPTPTPAPAPAPAPTPTPAAGLAALVTNDPNKAANTVRTGGGGFLVDSEGNIVTSTAFPGQVNYEAPKPTIPDVTLQKAADLLGVTPKDLLAVSGRPDEFGVVDPNQLSTTGLDYGTLKAMQDAGMGGLDISPTQTVDQALASKTTSDFLDKYGQSIVSALGPPGTGLLLAAHRGLGAIGSGKVTPGQGITDFGLGLISATMGVPVGTLRGALNGDFGAAASTTVQGLLNQQLSKATGIPGLLTGILLQESGIGRAAGNLADKAVSGIIPDQNWGTTDLISSGIDKGLTTIGDLFDFDLGAGAGTGSSSAGPDPGYDGGGRGGDNEAGTPIVKPPEEEKKPPMVGGGTPEAFAGYTSRIPIRRYIVETPDGPQIKYDYAEIPIG